MKLNYFGYHLHYPIRYQNIKFNLRPFLRGFCSLDNNEYKNRFTYNDENLYLFSISQDIFLFVTTRSSEIIKKINTDNWDIQEIYDILSGDERLGFASYIYVDEDFFGIASTFFAPKFKAFSTFVNDILTSIDHNKYVFTVDPFLYQTDRAEALSFPWVSSATVKLTQDSPFFDHSSGFFGFGEDELEEIECFEVKIKPKRRKKITKAFRKFLNQLPDEGIDQFVVKAKNDLDEPLADFYLTGRGAVSDPIYSKDELEICEEIRKRVEENNILTDKITEFQENENIQQVQIESIARLRNPGAWADHIS